MPKQMSSLDSYSSQISTSSLIQPPLDPAKSASPILDVVPSSPFGEIVSTALEDIDLKPILTNLKSEPARGKKGKKRPKINVSKVLVVTKSGATKKDNCDITMKDLSAGVPDYSTNQ